jgi:hypothetical protein
MNKRVEELAHQAGLDSFYVPEWSPWAEEFEKFAELIVQECMWKIMNRKEEAIDNDWDVDEAMSAAISDISKHFGVEE